MLHIVNKSPLDRNALDTCLATAQGGALLLIEDGVYAATTGNSAVGKLKQAMGQMKVYALKPDLEARGMADRVLDGVNLVDYGGFVDLVTEHATCQSWL
ncbi:MAG: Protein TusB [Rhodocyclaceae bacterium]|nr:MAG: sulfurtransferase complex subunit TusB [Rhodocyclaceae bacterium]MBE7421613.1 sulfurtransferase complex subunit TusB [Zoogloeaceae bacterium]MBV6409228.1 Protein TusB [Rhodocyclaceae bacterium]MCK6385173.1 sulfurtransferase complex subunit TusB [Rhodocyclaceae bacterium]CAG0945471.1 Protein TusB [Gammaproteobacteria bacterium]